MPRSHVARTNSEVQLREDTATAEWRDLCMFYRVVNGIRERQASNSIGIDNQFDGDNFGRRRDSSGNIIMPRSCFQHNQPLDAVTPYQYPNEVLPQTDYEGYSNQQENTSTHRVPLCSEKDDDWSISGYEDQEVSFGEIPIVEDDEDEDDGVFSMEL